MACPGHTGGQGTELDVQVMDGDLGHSVHVHIYTVSCMCQRCQMTIFTLLTKMNVRLISLTNVGNTNITFLTIQSDLFSTKFV